MHSFSDSFPLWLITGYWIQSPVLGTRTLSIHPVYNRLHLLVSNPYSIPPLRPLLLGNRKTVQSNIFKISQTIFSLYSKSSVISHLWSSSVFASDHSPPCSFKSSLTCLLDFPWTPHVPTSRLLCFQFPRPENFFPNMSVTPLLLSILFTSFTLSLKPVLTTPLAVLLSLLLLCFFHQTHLYLTDPLNVFLIVNPLKKEICLFIFCQFPSA